MKVAALFYGLLALGAAAPTATAAGLASRVAASNADVRAPAGRWVVDFANAQCVASRNYGTESQPLILGLKAPVAGDVMQVAVIRTGRGGRYADQLNATIATDGRTVGTTGMIAMMTGRDNQRLYRANLSLEQVRAVRGANTLTIAGGSEFRETFVISGMASLLTVMDQCVADLRRVWNASQGDTPSPGLRQRAQGSLQGIFRSDDYPGLAANEGAGGTVGFVVLIDETGRVADCTVTQSSGVAALDAQSCAIITQRARFQPAIGSDGGPAKDALHQRVTWRLE